MGSRARKLAKRRIRWLWDAGRIRYTEHAERRMAGCSLAAPDVLIAIRGGRITYERPGLFAETPRRYRLEGKSVDGAPMTCVVEINHELVIVTAYSKRKKATTGSTFSAKEEGR